MKSEPQTMIHTAIIWNYERKLQLQRERQGYVDVRSKCCKLDVRKTLQQMT